MFGDDTDGLFLSQIGYGNRKWYISGLYAHKHGGEGSDPAEGYSTPAVNMDDRALDAFGIRSYWTPEEVGTFIPTISLGFDWGFNGAEAKGQVQDSFGWMVGMTWNDAFIDGNKLGLAFGSYSSLSLIHI